MPEAHPSHPPVGTTSVAPNLRGLATGFADSVNGAQATFRTALQALAHPGRTFTLPEAAVCGQPQGLSFAMTALLLALADADTPIWLPDTVPDPVRAFFRFHCGCPFVALPHAARFVAVPTGFAAPGLQACDQGDPAYPDRSGTLLLEVASLDSGAAVQLRGPGIKDTQRLCASGLDDAFWSERRESQAAFPLGVDVILTSGAALSGLPRTTVAEK